jgi:hypothetical protein
MSQEKWGMKTDTSVENDPPTCETVAYGSAQISLVVAVC